MPMPAVLGCRPERDRTPPSGVLIMAAPGEVLLPCLQGRRPFALTRTVVDLGEEKPFERNCGIGGASRSAVASFFGRPRYGHNVVAKSLRPMIDSRGTRIGWSG